MQIKTVELSRLISYGTFHNVKIGVTVELDGDDSPHLALCRAQSWLHRELERMVGKETLKLSSLRQQELSLDEEPF